jgi:uncharacterized protein
LWRSWLPDFSLSWFDAKLGQLAHLPMSEESTRCGFGGTEIAVAPSGRLYPCERLIGEDRPDHPLRLPGQAMEGHDFLEFAPAAFEPYTPCAQCLLTASCDTTCRCSNFVRTGDINRPDGLLCLLNQATAQAIAHLLEEAAPAHPFVSNQPQNQRPCYAQ